jgi:hypothetical protein
MCLALLQSEHTKEFLFAIYSLFFIFTSRARPGTEEAGQNPTGWSPAAAAKAS